MNTTANYSKEMPVDGLTLEQLNADPFGDRAAQAFTSEDDRKLHVRFYMEPVEQTARSVIEGRRIFEETEFIEIMIPGDKQTVIKRQVFPMDRQRFPQHYARFKQGLADQTIGTPLNELTFISAAKVKEYEFFGIKTIEQLAGCPDGSQAGQSMMGFQGDKQKAAQFLEVAKGSAPVNELKVRLDAQERENETLKSQMAELLKRFEAQPKGKAVKAETE